MLYGAASSSGIGIDPFGALALTGRYPGTAANRENRIDLASLPPGDWVISIDLGFADGSGIGLIRVHAQ